MFLNKAVYGIDLLSFSSELSVTVIYNCCALVYILRKKNHSFILNFYNLPPVKKKILFYLNIQEFILEQFRGTTILSVRRDGKVVIGGDGQVSLGNTIIKGNARKVRRLYRDKVIAGFAGGTADAFTLFERFEGQLEKHQGHLVRSAVELAKEWRTDKILRKLEAMLIVANEKASLIITGLGDVMEMEDGILAIGSGGAFAQSSARALLENTDLSARDIVEKSLKVAGDICVYTNLNFTIEELSYTD